jgi:exonuclease III
MDTQNKNWKILSWNVHGMNDNRKWAAIRNTMEESACIAFCLQETKKCIIDSAFLKNICPSRFNKFEFLRSDGASGGILTIWNDNQFSRELVDSNSFAISVKLTSLQSGQQCFLSSVYGPCTPNGRAGFTNGLYNLDASAYELWLLLSDFNLIRHPKNISRPGGILMT